MCTGIKINYNDGCVMGRTMDYEVPLDYNALYLPKNYNFTEDLMGNPLSTRSEALGMCFLNKNPLKDGVNQDGLIGITNEFSGFNLYDSKLLPGKINISSLDFFTYALTNYKSVKELIKGLPNIHISTRNHLGEKVISPGFHYMFADSSQRCIVIEPKGKNLTYYDNPYDTMTNSPNFESHVKRLKKLIDLENLQAFNSSKNLPGGYDPVSRFIKAFYLTKMSLKSKDYREALANTYNILAAMTMPKGFVKNKRHNFYTYTRYVSAYDSQHKLLTIKSDTNPRVYQIGFNDIKEKNKRQAFFINESFLLENIIL